MKVRLKLHRCECCLRRGYHELRADDVLAALYCDKHAAALMESMAPIADEITLTFEDDTTIRIYRGEDDE